MGRINQDCISSEPEWCKVHETPNPKLVIVFTSAVYAKYGAQDTWHKIVKNCRSSSDSCTFAKKPTAIGRFKVYVESGFRARKIGMEKIGTGLFTWSRDPTH